MSEPKKVRQRFIRVGMELIEDLISGKALTQIKSPYPVTVTSDAPDDLRVVGVHIDPLNARRLIVTCESETFDELEVGARIPEFSITLHYQREVEGDAE